MSAAALLQTPQKKSLPFELPNADTKKSIETLDVAKTALASARTVSGQPATDLLSSRHTPFRSCNSSSANCADHAGKFQCCRAAVVAPIRSSAVQQPDCTGHFCLDGLDVNQVVCHHGLTGDQERITPQQILLWGSPD